MAQDIASLLVRIEATTQQMRRELAQGESAVGGFSKKIDGQLKSVDTAFDRAGKSAQSAMNVMRGAMAIAAGAGALGAVIKQADAYGQMASRIKMVTTDTAEYYAVQKRLMEISDRTYKPIQEQQELFIRSSKAMKELGYSTAETIDFIDSASSSLTINAASAETGRRAIDALSKSMVTGVVRGDEWRAVLEVMPTAVSDIAKNLGITETAVKQMGQSGKLSMDTFVRSMIAAREANAQLAEQMPTTVGDALTRLGNHFASVVGEINEAQGATAGLAEMINDLSDALSDGEFVAGAIEGFTNWTTAVSVVSGEISALTDQINQFTGDMTGSSFSIGEAFSQMPVNLRAAVQIAVVEVAHFVDGVLNKAEAAAAYLKALPGGLESAAQAYDSVRTRMQANDGAREESLEAIFAERDALLETGKAAAKAYLDQHNANTRISTERTASVKQLTKEEEDSAKRIAAAAKKSADAKLKALDSLISKYDPAAKAQAEYEKGIALADEALLKGKYTTEQYQKVVQGLYTDLNKPIWDKHNKQAKEAADAIKKIDDQLESVLDRLDPISKATRDYADEQKLLTDAMKRYPERAAEYQRALELLGREYEENKRKSSEWGQWTESALERVDSAFADAWRNIGDGFSSFRDSLTNAFKQMLAELAHMAITRPIVLQIGAALGIGGAAGQATAMMGGGSGGGIGVGSLLQYGQTAYSAITGVGPAALAGWQSGGLMGGIQGVGGYYGGALSGINAGAGQVIGTLLNGGGMTYAPLSYQLSSGALNGAIGGLAGIGGALYGYGQAGLKGAATGGLGAWGGATLGNILLPGIGGIIGGALGSALGGSLFGGKWQTKDVGLAFSVENGDFLGQQYEYQKKKGGLFSSNKKRTRYSALDAETAAALQQAYDATEAGVAGLFEALSYSVEEGSLDGLQMASKQISTKGKTEEEIQQAIAEWFGSAADAMTAELNKVFNTGLDLDFEGMQAFVGNLQGVNEVLRYLDVEMYDASVAGGKLAEALSAAAGGLDALAANSATYYGAFFTDAEKVEDTIDSITRAFEAADVELVSSREAYRAMVEDIDLTTEAGQEMFATLMQLSGQAAQYYDILEQQAAQANALLIGSVNTAYAALQRSIAAEQRELQAAYSARIGSLNDMAATASSNLSGMTGIANSLDAALKRLRGTSDDAVRMLRAQAVMTLNSALVTARAGGSLAGFEGLQDALDVASEMDASLYGSLEDFEREQGRTANLVAELEKVNGKQLTTEEKLLRSVQDQLKTAQKQYDADMAGLDAQLAFAQAQLDALNGIDNSVMGVAAAIAAMNASVVAALGALPKGAAQANTPQNNRSIVDSIYQSVLGRGTEGDEAGAAFWANALQNGTATYEDIATSIAKGALGNSAESAATKKSAEQYLKSLGIPGFASGGYTGRGDKYDPAGIVHKGEVVWSQSDIAKWGGVGAVEAMRKDGPELEVTGPSRIYNASQTAAMLGGGGDSGSVAELRQLRAEIHNDLRQMAKFMEQTATSTRQMNQSGVQIVGTVQTKGVAA